MMIFRRTAPPQDAEPLRIVRWQRLNLDCRKRIAVLDGQRYDARLGCWMYYLPALQAKLFHAAQGCIDCIHASRPGREELDRDGRRAGPYRIDEWRRALETALTRRLAEVWLVSVRLWKAGLGPQPLGVCFIDHAARDGQAVGPTCGMLIRNVFQLPRKLNGTIDQVRQAGVEPDKISSCVRRQVRGYVVDLCSVVGCVPSQAGETVSRLERMFREPSQDVLLQQALEETMRSS